MNTKNIIFAIIIIVVVGFVMYASGLEKEKQPTKTEPVTQTEPRVEPLTNTTVTIKPSTVITSTKPMTTAIITTNKGVVTLELFADKAPKTVENFTKLANAGFYNGTRFHRVIKGFMIQGGDPNTKDREENILSVEGKTKWVAKEHMDTWGKGGPGYAFADEIHAENKNMIGTISMANSGPNTNGSQFFINVANNNFLDPKHTVFGRVTAGMDVVTAIENVKTFEPGKTDRPLEEMVIQKIEIK